MYQDDAERSSKRVWSEHPLAALAVVAFGAALAALLVRHRRHRRPLAPDDEPPIRVRNGSIRTELDGGTWDGSRRHWKIRDGVRRQSDYLVLLAPTHTSDCQNTTRKKGKKLRFIYDADVFIEMKMTGNKTHLTSSHDLTKSPDSTTLILSEASFIKRIELDGTELCRFSGFDSQLLVIVTEP